MKIKPKALNASDLNIDELFTAIKSGKEIKPAKKEKKKPDLKKIVNQTDLEQHVESTREIIAKWESQQLVDALVMTVEFCHCNHCHHEWRQMKYGDLMLRYRNRKGSLYTYRPIETASEVPQGLQKLVQIEGKETSYCMVCFPAEALVENLADGYKTRCIIQGDKDQLDLFELEKRDENRTETQPSVSRPARERSGPLSV